MLIALPGVSFCLGSVVCGLICCIVIVICGGGTLYTVCYSYIVAGAFRIIQIICVAARARIKILIITFFYMIALSFYILSLWSLPLAIG